MNETEYFDTIVVGAGLAGLSCATRLAAGGRKVVVLEASEEELYPCNSRFSGGLFHIAMDDMVASEEVVLHNIERATCGAADPSLARALARNARPALEWLRVQGVGFMKAGPDGLRKFSLVPPRVRKTGLHWRGRCGDTMLRTLASSLELNGGEIRRGHEARRLLQEEGRCVGVEVAKQAGSQHLRASQVVLCDGGFQADPELLRQYISPAPERLLMRNAKTGRGAGIKMALELGAATCGMGSFYGHVHHRDAIHSEALWPFPVLDSLCAAGIMVNESAQRFADESLGGVYCANLLAGQDNPMGAWAIFDESIWQGPGRDWLLPPNPYLITAGATPLTAASPAELARKTALPASALQETLRAFNDSAKGHISIFPPRSGKTYPHSALDLTRLCALPLAVGVTYTTGGLAVNDLGQVLGSDDNGIIPGLFAAGASIGGLEGGPEHGYIGGLSKAATYGFICANSILAA